MSRLEESRAPDADLTPQEQKRVIAMVHRLCNSRQVPAWAIWTALYRFITKQVWQIKQQKENQ